MFPGAEVVVESTVFRALLIQKKSVNFIYHLDSPGRVLKTGRAVAVEISKKIAQIPIGKLSHDSSKVKNW